MTKLNTTITRKLQAQAQEAERKGQTKLAAHITEALNVESSGTVSEYSYQQMEEDIQQTLWKVAAHIMRYYDVKGADPEKIHQAVIHATAPVLEEFKSALNTGNMVVGPLEPAVPGQIK
jgi:hypothetical protein